MKNNNKSSTYSLIIEKIFLEKFSVGDSTVNFTRNDIVCVANDMKVALPKNLGDVIYSFRYRCQLPEAIVKTAPKGLEWIIEGTGDAKYVFTLRKINRIEPNPNLIDIKIPNATPGIVESNALNDEQAALAIVRYNRIIDLFLGITAYSLQNHLRTKVKKIGQIEVDEIYVGVNKCGQQFVIPVQAKGGTDKHSIVQTTQDVIFCAEKFPNLTCRPVSVQHMGKGRVAMFELCLVNNEIKLLDEKHYILVNGADISQEDLDLYKKLKPD